MSPSLLVGGMKCRGINCPVWQSSCTLGKTYSIESTTTKAKCTLESCVAYFRARPTRVWRTLEYALPGCTWHTLEYATTKDECALYRVQKLPRVRGGSY